MRPIMVKVYSLKITVLFSWLMLEWTNGLAQTSNQVIFNDQQSIQKISKGGGGYFASNPVYNGVDGTPYLFEWETAKIVAKGQALAKNYSVAYDAARDVFLVRENSVVLEIDEHLIDTIIVKDLKFVSIQDNYYQLLGKRGIPFLKKYIAEIQKPNYIPALNTGTKTSHWEIKKYFFVFHQSEVKPISLTKNSLQKVLSLDQMTLKQIEDKGLKFKRENDVIAILESLK